jgi:hypothetical protein
VKILNRGLRVYVPLDCDLQTYFQRGETWYMLGIDLMQEQRRAMKIEAAWKAPDRRVEELGVLR